MLTIIPLGSFAFELQDNRIIIQVRINGQGPFHMMLDTGATNILSNDVAQALGLSHEGRFPISGGGEDTVYASYCDVQKLEISSQTMLRSRFICMDLREMQKGIGWPHLDGLIGYEVFAQFLTEIDFDKMEVRLKPFSQRASPSAGHHVVPFTFDGTTPLIEGAVDGITEKFWLDTGDRASATLALPFIEQHQLITKYQPKFSTMTGYGLGGPLKTAMVFTNQFEFGDLVFLRTLIRLPTSKSQALNIPGIAGTIGMGLLRQFNMVFDYSRREMILSPSQVYGQDRSFDRAGMWIALGAAGAFEIRDVLEGGPAWTAGLRAQQIILAVDGVPTASMNVLKLREQLKDPVRAQVELKISDGKNINSVVVVLRDLI